MSVNPSSGKFPYHSGAGDCAFHNVDLAQLLSHTRSPASAVVLAVPVADNDDVESLQALAGKAGGREEDTGCIRAAAGSLWGSASNKLTAVRPAHAAFGLQVLHVLVCTVALVYFETCVHGIGDKDTLLLPPLAVYLGWHARTAALPTLDYTCLCTAVVAMAWAGSAQGKITRSYSIFSLSTYLTAHMLQKSTVYPLMCVALINFMLFGLSVVLPDAKVALSIWGLLVYAMALKAQPRQQVPVAAGAGS